MVKSILLDWTFFSTSQVICKSLAKKVIHFWGKPRWNPTIKTKNGNQIMVPSWAALPVLFGTIAHYHQGRSYCVACYNILDVFTEKYCSYRSNVAGTHPISPGFERSYQMTQHLSQKILCLCFLSETIWSFSRFDRLPRHIRIYIFLREIF